MDTVEFYDNIVPIETSMIANPVQEPEQEPVPIMYGTRRVGPPIIWLESVKIRESS